MAAIAAAMMYPYAILLSLLKDHEQPSWWNVTHARDRVV